MEVVVACSYTTEEPTGEIHECLWNVINRPNIGKCIRQRDGCVNIDIMFVHKLLGVGAVYDKLGNRAGIFTIHSPTGLWGDILWRWLSDFPTVRYTAWLHKQPFSYSISIFTDFSLHPHSTDEVVFTREDVSDIYDRCRNHEAKWTGQPRPLLRDTRVSISNNAGYREDLTMSVCIIFHLRFHTGVLFGLFFDHEYGSELFLRNVALLSTDCTTLYPRRYNSS
jgi:hypothetical protein